MSILPLGLINVNFIAHNGNEVLLDLTLLILPDVYLSLKVGKRFVYIKLTKVLNDFCVVL
jgi:hypothetical protein